MIRTKKVRLIPDKEQERKLFESANIARWAYNWTLKMQIYNYRFHKKILRDNELRKHITKMKKRNKYSWLNNVSNNIPKQAVKDACKAYKNWLVGVGKNGYKTGRPRFKKKNKTKLSFYNDNVRLLVKKKTVLLEKIGWVKTSEQLPVGVKYYNPRITFDGKYWYISIGLEIDHPKSILCTEVLGIDLGIKNLAVVSDGRIFPNINKTKTVKNIEKRLRRLQRSVARKYLMNKEGNRFVKTCNIYRLEKKIRLLYRRLSNIRTNHIHHLTTDIVKTKPCKVVIESLNIKEMMKNRYLAKSIAEQKFFEIKRQLIYKCEELGIKLVEADRFYPSSKICNRCKYKKTDFKLSERIFYCEKCGYSADRDYNASLNLADYPF